MKFQQKGKKDRLKALMQENHHNILAVTSYSRMKGDRKQST